ncbi:hypothetical protein QTP70_018540, partial [Hemibagrus guttatus]
MFDDSKKKTFQYVPILPLLSQLLNNRHIHDTVLQNRQPFDVSLEYKSLHDGQFFYVEMNIDSHSFFTYRMIRRAKTEQTMKVLVIHNPMAEDDPVDMTIVIEGIQVISGCGYKTKAFLAL